MLEFRALLSRFVDRFGHEPELDSLAEEKDPELQWQSLLSLAEKLERGDRLEPAAALFGEVAGAARQSHPELSAKAERALQAMLGQGEGGARFEFLLRRFLRDSFEPATILAFGMGSLAFRSAKLAVLSRLWLPGQGYSMGRVAAGLVASAVGLGAETPIFLLSSKLGRQVMAGPQDWNAETLAQELVATGLTLFCLKGAGTLSRMAIPNATTGLARVALPQLGMFAGIVGERRIEESLGLHPHLEDATLLTDALTTHLQFLVGGNLAERFLGRPFRALQSSLEWRPPRWNEAEASVALGLAPAVLGKERSLSPAPLLSSGDDFDDALQAGTRGLRYGFGKDTVMQKWFPDNATASNAVPMFTSAVGRLHLMLRTAYQHRPDWQHPRTILLERGLEALQKISPNIEVTPALLDSLTKSVGSQVPEKTPFRIMQVSERRTFIAKVHQRVLEWSEINDPMWARINRHSGMTEFEAQTPLELYLYIESLSRQANPSYQTEYRIRYLGPSPASYEVSLVKFLERSLRFYRVAGRSLVVEFQDGGATQRFSSQNGEWTLEGGGETSPAQMSPLSPAPPPAAAPRRASAIAPFAVVATVQGLKDMGSLLADPSLPRRIELWLQASGKGSLEGETWRQAFKDLRPGSVLVVHDSHARKSFTFQRREDRVFSRSSIWTGPLAWEPGIPLSSRDVMDLFQQLHFIRSSKIEPGQALSVSLLGDWETSHDKMLLQQLNHWGDLPFERIEVRHRRRPEILLRFRRNQVGKFVSD